MTPDIERLTIQHIRSAWRRMSPLARAVGSPPNLGPFVWEHPGELAVEFRWNVGWRGLRATCMGRRYEFPRFGIEACSPELGVAVKPKLRVLRSDRLDDVVVIERRSRSMWEAIFG